MTRSAIVMGANGRSRFGRRVGLATGAVLGLLVSASSLQAQPAPPPPPPSEDIVVQGRPQATFETVKDQAVAVTRPGDLINEPIAKFQSPVCPGIIGLADEYASLMVDRIRVNAERAGLTVSKQEPCRPNIIIAFVEDGKAAMEKFQHQRGELFNGMTRPERDKLVADPGPVHAWSSISIRSRDGIAIPMNRDAGEIPVLNSWMAHSLIYLTTRLDIEASVVVIDRAATEGMSIKQLADYATMRSLARTRPAPGGAPLGTILSLFDKESTPPDELTAFDIAYLDSVYRGPANMPAYSNVSAVGRTLRKAAEAAEDGAKR